MDGDVISGAVVDQVGLKLNVHAKFGTSRLHCGRIIRLFVDRTVLRTFVQYLIAFCSRPEKASDVISGRFVRQIATRAQKSQLHFNNH